MVLRKDINYAIVPGAECSGSVLVRQTLIWWQRGRWLGWTRRWPRRSHSAGRTFCLRPDNGDAGSRGL